MTFGLCPWADQLCPINGLSRWTSHYYQCAVHSSLTSYVVHSPLQLPNDGKVRSIWSAQFLVSSISRTLEGGSSLRGKKLFIWTCFSGSQRLSLSLYLSNVYWPYRHFCSFQTDHSLAFLHHPYQISTVQWASNRRHLESSVVLEATASNLVTNELHIHPLDRNWMPEQANKLPSLWHLYKHRDMG